jgi:low density lipoprotein receptor-related protein 5/6
VEVFLNSANGQVQPFDIAVDPYSRTLYWTDSQNNVVNVTRLDMTPVGVVLQANNFKPRSIALFPERGSVTQTFSSCAIIEPTRE